MGGYEEGEVVAERAGIHSETVSWLTLILRIQCSSPEINLLKLFQALQRPGTNFR